MIGGMASVKAEAAVVSDAQFSITANTINDKEHIYNIDVKGKNGDYQITGKVHVKGPFYYTVEDGHYSYILNKKLPIKNGEFNIKIALDQKKLPKNGTLLLYIIEEGGKSFPVVLEVFKP